MAVKQREREAGGGPGAGGGGAGESPYAALEGVLREVYDAARGLRQEQRGRRKRLERRVELPELGDLLVKVSMGQRFLVFGFLPSLRYFSVYLEVFKRGHRYPLCEVQLPLDTYAPHMFKVVCDELMWRVSSCINGEGCVLSLEEARAALGLAGWAANVLAVLAGIPVKVEKVGLVEAYNTKDGKLYVFPCLQVSAGGERRSVCQGAFLQGKLKGGWEIIGIFELVPIGEAHIKMARMLVELKKIVEEYTWNREREGAKSTRARKHQGEFLRLEEVVLRRRDGTEEVLLEPWFLELEYIGEDFTVVYCLFSDICTKSSNELADAIRKELNEVVKEVVQECRRYTEELDPRYAALAYIAAEALRKAWPEPA